MHTEAFQGSWTMLKHLCLYLTSLGDNTLRLHVREDGLWHSPINDGGLVIDLKGYRRSVSSGALFFQYSALLSTSRAGHRCTELCRS